MDMRIEKSRPDRYSAGEVPYTTAGDENDQERSAVLQNGLQTALALCNADRLDDALDICSKLVALDPACADAWHLLGLVSHHRGYYLEAQQHISRAIHIAPNNLHYHNNLGAALTATENYQEAEIVLTHALNLAPEEASGVLCNLGHIYLLRKQYPKAIVHFEKALALSPDLSVALANKGVALQSCGQHKQAIEDYRRAIEHEPNQPAWWANMGVCYLSLGHYNDATDCFQKALSILPDYGYASNGLTAAYLAMGKFDACTVVAQKRLKIDPQDTEATAHLALVHQKTAHWKAFEDILPHLHRQTIQALDNHRQPTEKPFANVCRSTDRALNLAVARAWSSSIAKRTRCLTPPFAHAFDGRRADGRLTVGYLSADFRNHAVAYQVAALFALHDREQFRVLGFSVGLDDGSRYRRQIAASCDRFLDLANCDTRTAAQTINDQSVDILVDMMGHTAHNRLDICALRPAPLQISYLGFLASTGSDFIDYLIGDPVVTPPEHADDYTEKIIRLPGCYQIISPVAQAAQQFTRQEMGLPDKYFVYCCFNQAYKIDARIFNCWMRILKAVPLSVLWLFRSNDASERRFKEAATQVGVSPQRLIFADKMDIEAHIQRLALADLALDTPGYNGGATTANALIAGIPLITTAGDHFVSRMSASHLMAAGLPELVVADLDAYIKMAIDLARMPRKMNELRRALKSARVHHAIFDSKIFVRNLEHAYRSAWHRYCRGLAPDHFDIHPGLNQAGPPQVSRICTRQPNRL